VDKKSANKISKIGIKVDLILGRIYDESYKIVDIEEAERIRMAIGMLILDFHEKIILPIAAQYPDLHPDKAETD
jgi:hypothetical protein